MNGLEASIVANADNINKIVANAESNFLLGSFHMLECMLEMV